MSQRQDTTGSNYGMPAADNVPPASVQLEEFALAEMRESLKRLLQENEHLKTEVEDVRRLNNWAAELLDPTPEPEPIVALDPLIAPPSPTPAQRRSGLKRVRQD
ncbi:hypothetical protein WJX75_008730 [Coccomyxa subellipsoidea]|uniref:Uncharacterized protein n=1 Tax=Coccomyxa subellipsoidea TaxID=248742 RepID=A0ABR2YWQ0_9CHLO